MHTRPVRGRKRAPSGMSKKPTTSPIQLPTIKHHPKTSSSSVTRTAPTGSVQAVAMTVKTEAMVPHRTDTATGTQGGGNKPANPVPWASLVLDKPPSSAPNSPFCHPTLQARHVALFTSTSSAVVYPHDPQPNRHLFTTTPFGCLSFVSLLLPNHSCRGAL